MKRLLIAAILLITLVAGAYGCNESPGSGEEIAVDTEFGRMLGYVPASFLDEFNLLYADYELARELHNAPSPGSIAAMTELPADGIEAFQAAFRETGAVRPDWQRAETFDIVGFDIVLIDRLMLLDAMPPDRASYFEGNFDEELITGKFAGLGYSEIEYGLSGYYSVRNDYQISLTDPLGSIVLADMNHVMINDNAIMVSAAKGRIEGVIDARGNNVPGIMDKPECRALADSLGEVLMGAMSTPDRLIQQYPDGSVEFDMDIGNWGELHQYQMAALGYRADGDERYLDIALYYTDAGSAEADGDEIVKRMQEYTLDTFYEDGSRGTTFTDHYQPGQPELREYDQGAVLLICCRLKGQAVVSGTIFGSSGATFRDLLFLAPDPDKYLVE